MGLMTVISATGLAAGLALTGVGVASASSPAAPAAPTAASSAAVTLPSGGVLEQRVTRFCTRVPKLIERADKAQTRLSGDAGTKGSLAWLKAEQAKAEKADHKRVVKRLDRVITRRTERLAKLPTVEANLAKAQTECGTLDLPTPSPSASPSSSS